MGKPTPTQHIQNLLISRARQLMRQVPGSTPATVVAQVIAELGDVIQLEGRVSTLAAEVEAALRDNATPEPEAGVEVTEPPPEPGAA